jgi:hypothetical protein
MEQGKLARALSNSESMQATKSCANFVARSVNIQLEFAVHTGNHWSHHGIKIYTAHLLC